MNNVTRGAFLKSTGVGAAGLALGGWQAGIGLAHGQPSAPLEAVEVNSGFKERTGGDAAELAYGRAVRDRLHETVLNSIHRAHPQGHVAQLRVAEDVLGRIAGQTDPSRIRELWVYVTGNVHGKYRGREYLVEL